jgi:hypothetical protein
MTPDKYSAYCKEHLREFRDELRDEASLALSGWPGKSTAVLLIIVSLMTYDRLESFGNPFSTRTLFTYAFPIFLILLFPLATIIYSKIEKFSRIVLDIVCLSIIVGFCLNLSFVFAPDVAIIDQSSLFIELGGQTAFTLLMTTAFSYHTSFSITVMRNTLFTLIFALLISLVNVQYLQLNLLQIIEGFVAGTIFSWIFFLRIQLRFYYKSIDADTRQHLYKQLSKLVYPHQLAMIKAGEQLEDTMPIDKGRAIINVFDIQRSSDIRHEKTSSFLLDIFRAFSQICMMGYQHNPLKSRAFRLKETGDGFISSIGYPFLTDRPDALADHALETAFIMLRAFNAEVKRFNYSRPIKASMGMAYNSVQGTFQSSGIKSYDLYGEALVQAYRYEEIRKHSVIAEIIKAKAHSLGLEHYNIVIIQEVIFNSLSPHYQQLFAKLDMREYNFQVRQDIEAHFIYFHVRE